MDCLTAVFGMGVAHHVALKDCDGEAAIFAALGRNVAAEWQVHLQIVEKMDQAIELLA